MAIVDRDDLCEEEWDRFWYLRRDLEILSSCETELVTQECMHPSDLGAMVRAELDRRRKLEE